MADRSDRDELTEAWRALAGQHEPGWQTIAVCAGARCRFLAGRSHTNAEALLIEVASVPSPGHLPSGRGFLVESVQVPPATTGWLALSRRATGSLELFTAMAEDIIGTVERSAAVSQSPLAVFLDRVRAWQAFMDRPGDGPLTPAEELGLVGELHAVDEVIRLGVPGVLACEGWVGPSGNLHDFRWGAGGIEVKSTLSEGSFPARILSLDQLDSTKVFPLFIVCARLHLAAGGTGLPARVAQVRQALAGQPAAAAVLENRLLEAGYRDAHEPSYTRRFALVELRCLAVDDSLARLIHGSVPAAVLAAEYVLNLDAPGAAVVPLRQALSALGVA
jgi:hypothetical protein